jgi:Protein of unknown function (DUF4013)
MRYWRAYQFVFDHPKWTTNLLFGAVCALIPVIGPIVLMGWLYEIIEGMQRRGESGYADFDFGKFGQYLMRGVWPFLVSLALSLLVVPVVLIFMVVLMLVISQSGGKPNVGLIFGIEAAYIVVLLAFSLILSIFTTPILLRAGLMQEFKAAFNLAFVTDFAKKMWKETLLMQLFLMGTGILVALCGLLLCCVGVYPAQVLVSMANAHLTEQLYMLYLQRGGMAIPLKPEPGTFVPETGGPAPM